MERTYERRKRNSTKMNCIDCNRNATHIRPFLLCDHCWSERYGTQNVDGVAIPFKKLFRDNLMKRGLWKKEKESTDEWGSRCELATKKSKLYENTIGKSKG